MNKIRQIKELNQRELEAGISPEASWHADYRDTAYIYIGGLPFELSEGDVVTIFSQYGEPTFINLVRDKETGKSRGFAFLKYEDQRSTDLAVDNLGGAVILGKTLSVDHTRYKKKDDAPEEGMDLREEAKRLDNEDEGRRKRRKTDESESEEERPVLKEERELAKLIQEHDEEDPMKAFLIEEKKEEIKLALARLQDSKIPEKSHKHRHRHHRSRREKGNDEELDKSKHSSRRNKDRERIRSPSGDRSAGRNREGESRKQRSRSREKSGRSDDFKNRRRSPRRNSRDYRDIKTEENNSRRRAREDSLDDRREGRRQDS